MLARADTFDAVIAEISLASREAALLIVPGGGPFADTVRDIDRQVGLSDDAAHWMAILAMDQYAHLIASRLPSGEVVCGPDEIESALKRRRTPVLAPYQWMRDADPLPHSWDVTSDSISAWVAGQVGADSTGARQAVGRFGARYRGPLLQQRSAASHQGRDRHGRSDC